MNLDLTDDGSVLIALPFDFEFFGDAYREVWVNTNGNVSFNQSVGAYKPESFPIVVPMIAPFWADLVPTADKHSGVFVHTEADRVHILWRNLKVNTPGVEDVVSFELILQAGTAELAKSAVVNDSKNPQDDAYQGDNNKQIIINYSDMSVDAMFSANGITPLNYVTGINSAKKKCGYHSFDLSEFSIVAYVTK